jgi:hypothetical protein
LLTPYSNRDVNCELLDRSAESVFQTFNIRSPSPPPPMAKAGKHSQRAHGRLNHQKHRPRSTVGKANALGYAKRQARKSLTGKNVSASDVYEFAPEATRRENVTLTLDAEEAREYRVGIDGDDTDEERRQALKARLIGENVENEMIDSDDDEEIDSDAAFDESDEDRFAGFFSSRVRLTLSTCFTLGYSQTSEYRIKIRSPQKSGPKGFQTLI